MNKYKSIIALFISISIAFIALNLYQLRKIQADDFALGKENTSRSETLGGVPYTGHTMVEIRSIVSHYASESIQHKVMLWLGNSQLHTINQFKQGEHLAPYWIRKAMNCEACLVPLGLSLSNANPQENFVLTKYVTSKLKPNVFILQVEFMGFRESGLRNEFVEILSDDLIYSLRAYPEAKELSRLAIEVPNIDKNKDASDSQGKLDTEDYLTEKIGSVWPLWKDRGSLRSNLLSDLFTLRNWVFNISSKSQRNVIKPRYEKNMKALGNLLEYSKAVGIPVILYIAPVRHDLALPYNNHEYSHWKEQVAELANQYSAQFLNFEDAIPGEYWGSNFGEDIDYMHFREQGHKIIADKLLPFIRAKMK